MADLFQPFAQIGTAQKQGGTGLGLAITKRFCELMGGTITVTSELGKGSEFVITLPRISGSPAVKDRAAAQMTSVTPMVSSLPTVLVIDDDPAARDLIHRYLSREHVNAVLAGSGEEGLRLAREVRPDVITLDVLMPGIDGWAVLQALKSDPELCDIPVIIATMVTDRGLGYALGASDYLVKPVTRERLSEVLRKHHCARRSCVVMVVDDDIESRSMLRSMLHKESCEVVLAEDGVRALEELSRRIPDMILLDLLMPNMDGFEFTAELRKHEEWRRVAVIVITAKDLTPEERQRLNGHVEKILFKGTYTQEDLLTDIRRLTSGAAARPGESQSS